MVASACCRKARWLVALWLSASGSARAQVSSQAELTSVLDSGDLLGSGAQGARVEDPPWQSLASLRRGDENRTRLSLSTSQAGLLPGVTTSALLRVELALNEPATSPAARFRDVSSWLGVSFRLARQTQLSLRAFPLDTDYLRLGYLHALDWGGTDAERGESIFLQQTGTVPGCEVAFEAPGARLFAALKWASVDDPLRGSQRAWGALSGGSAELSATLRVEGGFGYFQRPAPVLAPTSSRSFVEGASLRVVWHRGAAEPELSAEPFRPPSLREDPPHLTAEMAPGVAVALEGVTLVERRRRFESASVAALEPAPAAALYGSVRGQSLALHAAVTWRSLAFVLRNDARLNSDETLPPSALEHAELTAWLGGSVTLRPLFLVPSVELALRLPAAVETPSVLPGFGQTLLAGGPAGLEALPIGSQRLPVVSARVGTRFQASTAVALALFADFTRNPNLVVFAAAPEGVTRSFARPERLALVAAAQARF